MMLFLMLRIFDLTNANIVFQFQFGDNPDFISMSRHWPTLLFVYIYIYEQSHQIQTGQFQCVELTVTL